MFRISVNIRKYLLLFAVLLAAVPVLACNLSVDLGGEPTPDLVSTQNSLIATQMALEAIQQQMLQTEPVQQQVQEAEVPPTQAPPVEAQPADTPVPDVLYNGIAFSYDSSIADGVTPSTMAAEIFGEDAMPGANHPAYDEFDFYGYALSDTFHTPKISVYPVDEYTGIDPVVGDIVTELKSVLASKPAQSPPEGMPFMPRFPAAQFMASNIRYLDFQNGSGVRYLTQYGQAIYPVSNYSLFYTFQGLSSDGAYYLAAVLPVSHAMLPADDSIPNDDFAAFEANFQNYLVDTTNQLNAQPDESFNPSLALLDGMMQSFKIK